MEGKRKTAFCIVEEDQLLLRGRRKRDMRKSLEVSYRMGKRSKELLAALLAMNPSKFGSLTRWIFPEKRYSDRHRRPGSEGRGY